MVVAFDQDARLGIREMIVGNLKYPVQSVGTRLRASLTAFHMEIGDD